MVPPRPRVRHPESIRRPSYGAASSWPASPLPTGNDSNTFEGMVPSSATTPDTEPELRAHRAQLLLAREAYEAARAALCDTLGRRVFFLFEAAEMSWALPVDAVSEVVPAAALAPIPGAPPWLRGLLQVGPTTFPVIDLAARLAGPALPLELDDRFILCGDEISPFAVRASRVFDVRRLDDVRAAREEEGAPGVELLGVATGPAAPVWLLSPSGLAAAARTRASHPEAPSAGAPAGEAPGAAATGRPA